MNAKTTRKYELITQIAGLGASDAAFPALLAELCSIDYQTAFEMWEFMLSKHSASLSDKAVCNRMEVLPFTMFLRISETKMRTLFTESLPLQKLIYGICATAGAGNNLAFLTSLISASKIDTADECLQKLRGNSNVDFNELMLTIVNDVFAAYCAKNNVRVPVLNKKQKTLLLDYIGKIKGSNKALLTQRLKEL